MFTLSALFRGRGVKLYLDRGRVSCPVRGCDVDLERCLLCARLERVDVGDQTLVCDPSLERPGPIVDMRL